MDIEHREMVDKGADKSRSWLVK